MDKPEILISIYAAIISTIALLWNIINSILDKMSRLEVKSEFYTTMIFPGSNAEQGPGLMQITIVNKSKKTKYIKTPQLQLSYNHGWNNTNGDKHKNRVNLCMIADKRTYPLEMKSESELILKYPFDKASEWICKESSNNSKFKVIITDTTGKEYKSKSLSINELKNCINHNKTINPIYINAINN